MKKRTLLLAVCAVLVAVPYQAFSQDTSFSGASSDGTSAAGTTDDRPAAVDESTLLLSDASGANSGGDGSLNVFSAWDFIRMVLILAAVIAAIYGIFFILKRSGGPRLQENKIIRLLSSKPISNNRSLHLVEVGNQVFLVGSAENSVSLVSEIQDKETLDALKLQATSAEFTERRRFGDVIAQMFGKPDRAGVGTMADPLGFIRRQRERLKNI